jgi:hypothetical protein
MWLSFLKGKYVWHKLGCKWCCWLKIGQTDDAGFSALDHVRHLPIWVKKDEWWCHISVLKLSTVQENSCRLTAMTCDKDRLRFQRLTLLHLSPIPKFSTPVSVSGVNIWSLMTAMVVKEVCWNHLMHLSAWGDFLDAVNVIQCRRRWSTAVTYHVTYVLCVASQLTWWVGWLNWFWCFKE